MPCVSDYLAPSAREIEATKVNLLLDELDGKELDPREFKSGMDKRVYNRGISQKELDDLTAYLCARLQRVDPTEYSLELQMWWRDHQKADKYRAEAELQKKRSKEEKDAALAKLTPYERALLGVRL